MADVLPPDAPALVTAAAFGICLVCVLVFGFCMRTRGRARARRQQQCHPDETGMNMAIAQDDADAGPDDATIALHGSCDGGGDDEDDADIDMHAQLERLQKQLTESLY